MFQTLGPNTPDLIRTSCPATMVACLDGVLRVAASQKADHMLLGTTHAQEEVPHTVECEMG